MKSRARRLLRCLFVWAVRYGPLLLSAGAVYGLWLAFRRNDVVPNDAFDARLVVGMGTAYALAALVMLVFNREWTVRALGQTWTYIADAGLWGGLGAYQMGWRHRITLGELLWLRAAFVVGVVCLVAGLGVYLIGRLCRWWPWWPKTAYARWRTRRDLRRRYGYL